MFFTDLKLICPLHVDEIQLKCAGDAGICLIFVRVK